MATSQVTGTQAHARAHASLPTHARTNLSEALHRVRDLARSDQAFAKAFRMSDTPQRAAALARRYGIEVSPEALWRNRGTLAHGGLPTWRG
ncbi:MAG: hypothetical protein ER33_08335 [Cyanobium sp. CACIAM 14]|nr:MAG: hypothetical protein ER33_08335 [Cyanobium sp. CACIAM 14]